MAMWWDLPTCPNCGHQHSVRFDIQDGGSDDVVCVSCGTEFRVIADWTPSFKSILIKKESKENERN